MARIRSLALVIAALTVLAFAPAQNATSVPAVVAQGKAASPGTLVVSSLPPMRIAVVGDSLSCGGLAGTDGWCPELSRLLSAAGVDHVLLPLAVGGTRCSYWVDHVADVLDDADLMILGCGTNDGADQRPATELYADISAIIAQADDAGVPLLTGIPAYSSPAPASWEARPWLPAAQHEAYIGIRAATAGRVIFDDTAMPALSRFVTGDGVHPTPAGYLVLAHNRYRALRNLLPGMPDIGPDCMQIGHAPGQPRPRGVPCYGRPGA